VYRDRTQARELAGLKSDFLSTVTHELRTPLTSVKGSLQLVLGKSSALSPIDCELLNISLKNADRLIRLINDLLDISRLELGKIELTFAKVPTASLVEEAAAGLRAYASGRAITIDAEIDDDVPAIEGDRDRLIQVLTNLISNAVKFSPHSGRVLVRATRYESDVAIAVRDWGVGIRAADQDRLFQRFQRLNPSHSDEPGTGLGLAISKAIVDRHGGRVSVASGENEGSTFTVFIPAAESPAETGAALAARSATEPPTVLLVDDDEALAARLRAAWDARYRLVHVTRGADALDIARIHRPDCVLLDVVLPDLSGYDVLRILRDASATAAIPVVMLTIQPERALATNLGAVDVIGKPADLERLTTAVDQAVAGRAIGGALRIAVGACDPRRSELIAALRSAGHHVVEARDERDLLRCAEQHAADVAVVGPDATAGRTTQLIRLLRDHPGTRSVPVVLLGTSEADAKLAGCTWMHPDANDEAVLEAIELAGRRSVAA
jgi:CheY-like chemotaxis protein/anti-sigma regulatory factor (Ser/Thr protein kinase)